MAPLALTTTHCGSTSSQVFPGHPLPAFPNTLPHGLSSLPTLQVGGLRCREVKGEKDSATNHAGSAQLQSPEILLRECPRGPGDRVVAVKSSTPDGECSVLPAGHFRPSQAWAAATGTGRTMEERPAPPASHGSFHPQSDRWAMSKWKWETASQDHQGT